MENAKSKKRIRKNGGSALILVVVVTVLLAVIGIMFLMVSRVGDVMGTAAEQEQEMDQAVQTVTGRIEMLLMQDLFGTDLKAPAIADGSGASNEPYDAPGTADPWLASLEPKWINENGTPNDPTDDLYQWDHITNISDIPQPTFQNMLKVNWNRTLLNGTGPVDTADPARRSEWGAIIPEYQSLSALMRRPPDGKGYACPPADADGDGVADSVWIRIDRPSDIDGMPGPDPEWLYPDPADKPIYAAVRIVDNCAMLNLNTAQMTRLVYPNVVGDGKYLSQVDYQVFLRGDDQAVPAVIKSARRLNHREAFDTFQQYQDNVILHIENPNEGLAAPKYALFDLGDELEMRNRFFLTSSVLARFEQRTDLSDPFHPLFGCYETFDYERGEFVGGWNVALRVRRNPIDTTDDLKIWKLRMNPENFDYAGPWNGQGGLPDYTYYYDRRHICTFTSFDRNLRWNGDPFLAMLPTEPARDIYRKVFMPAEGHAVSVRADIVTNTPEARRNILHLLCAFRAYYMHKGSSLEDAARKSAQIVANMIDYLDDDNAAAEGPFFDPWTDPDTSVSYPGQTNDNPTYIDRALIKRLILQVSSDLHTRDSSVPNMNVSKMAFQNFDFGLESGDVVFGFERQPFISELYTRIDGNTGRVTCLAVELLNPYNSVIPLDHWQVVLNGSKQPRVFAIPENEEIAAGTTSTGTSSFAVLDLHSSTAIPAAESIDISGSYSDVQITAMLADPNCTIDLQRPDPRDPNPRSPTMFITVDQIRRSQFVEMLRDVDTRDGQPTYHTLQRGDKAWAFTNAAEAKHQYAVPPNPNPARLGMANSVTGLKASGYQLPVADIAPPPDPLPGQLPLPDMRRFFTLGDFEKVLFVGNQAGDDPNTVTWAIAAAKEEGDIRFDIVKNPELMGTICFLNRPEGSLPGRININTAATNVMAAAIPGNFTDINPATPAAPLTTSDPRAGYWNSLDYAQVIPANRPYENLGDLVDKVSEFRTYAASGSPDVGTIGITDDLEERDWILSPLSNIFTTRSDVFTAYILVRVGQNGPQRRVIAVFDRSQVWTPEDRPRLLALKTVSNPR